MEVGVPSLGLIVIAREPTAEILKVGNPWHGLLALQGRSWKKGSFGKGVLSKRPIFRDDRVWKAAIRPLAKDSRDA